MRRAGGYAVIVNPRPSLLKIDDPSAKPELLAEGVIEFDTFQCKHCGFVKHVRPKERPEDLGGLCKQCMGLICPRCVNEGGCTPLEKRIIEMEERGRILRTYEV